MKEQAQSRYAQLRSERENFLDMGRDCAKLTLPYLLVKEGEVEGGNLHSPYQSVGAKGVNVLASKIMLSLFPINTSFFKLQINDAELAKALAANPELNAETTRSEIDVSLSKIEKVTATDL
jgi:hypothetical protein